MFRGQLGQQIGPHRHGLFGCSRGRRRAEVGNEIDERRVGLVSHGRNQRNRAGGHGADHDFLVEAPEVFERAAAPRHDDDIGLSRHVVEALDCRCDLGGRSLALHPHRPDDDMAGKALVEAMENVADHRTCGRGDDPDDPGQVGNGLLALSLEQAFGGELSLALFEQRHQRADARGLDVLDDDLIGRLLRIRSDLAGGDDLEPLLQFRAQPAEAAAPDHGVDLGTLVLDREIAVARGYRPAETRDFAPHPHMAETVFQRALQRLREFADGHLAGI